MISSRDAGAGTRRGEGKGSPRVIETLIYGPEGDSIARSSRLSRRSAIPIYLAGSLAATLFPFVALGNQAIKIAHSAPAAADRRALLPRERPSD